METTDAVFDARASVDRTPVVLLPGTMSSGLAWRFQTEFLRSQRPICIPDSHFGLPSIAQMAADICSRVPLRFDLVAWSMGGYIAFELYPLVHTRVDKLILISTSARPESLQARERRRTLLSRVENQGLRKVWSEELEAELFDPSRVASSFQQEIVEDAVSLGMSTLRAQISAMTGRADTRSTLREIGCDTLVISGRHDEVTPPECTEEIACGIRGATLVTIDDVGHCSPWELPNTVNRLILDFLNTTF